MAWSFATRHDRLRTRMRAINSRTVSYRRGNRIVEEIQATVYELKTEELIAFGLPVDAKRRDYIIDLAGLEEAGKPFDVPKQGDEIRDGELVCQVVPKGQLPCYKFTNHQRNEVRVHTQVISK